MSHSAQSRRIESESYEAFTRRVIDPVWTVPAKSVALLPLKTNLKLKTNSEPLLCSQVEWKW